LEWIENILPNIQGGVGISESQNQKLGVNTHNAFDILCLLLNVVSVDWLIAWITHFALPVQKIGHIISSND